MFNRFAQVLCHFYLSRRVVNASNLHFGFRIVSNISNCFATCDLPSAALWEVVDFKLFFVSCRVHSFERCCSRSSIWSLHRNITQLCIQFRRNLICNEFVRDLRCLKKKNILCPGLKNLKYRDRFEILPVHDSLGSLLSL